MSDFSPGFSSRHQLAADLLADLFTPPEGFAAVDITEKARGQKAAAKAPRHFSPEAPGPRHFSPADPDANPTKGWDPLDPSLPDAEADQAFIDPIAQARMAGFAEGKAAALAELGKNQDRQAELLRGIADALGQGLHVDRAEQAERLRGTVIQLVRRTIGEAEISGELLRRRIDAAVQMLSETIESALLRLHPEDLPLVDGHLPRGVFAVGDSTLDRGAFALETATTLIEDGPAMWLEQLQAAISRIAAPQ